MAPASSQTENVRRVVKDLATMSSDGSPVFSLYLDTRWRDEHQRERVRLFVENRARELRHAWRGREWGPRVDETLRLLQDKVVGDLVTQANEDDVDADGFAFFMSPSRRIFTGLRTRVGFENELEVADRPVLMQLAHVVDYHSPAFVTLVDGRWMRIFEVALGGVVLETEIEQYLPDRTDSGDRGPFSHMMRVRAGPAALARSDGMSQMRHQRHIREHLEHNLKTAAGVLTRLVGLERAPPIVICGEPELRGLFKRVMPEAVRDLIAHEMRMDSKAPRHEVVRRAVKVLLERSAHERSREIDDVIGQALGGGLCVLGTEETLLALQESRLHTLYLDVSAGVGRGWLCGQCDALGRKAEVRCPFCGGATSTTELAHEMTRRALGQETRVVTVRDHVRLRHFRGMAGTLRRGISPTGPGVGFTSHEPFPPI